VTRVVRIVVGMALGLVAVVAPAWGIFHLVRQGSCGDVGQSACPDATGTWIIAIVLSATIAGPLAVLIAGSDRRGVPWLLGPVIGMFTVGLLAGVGVSLAGTSADDGTEWMGIVILGIGAIVTFGLVRGVLLALIRTPAASRTGPMPAPPPSKRIPPPRDQQLAQLSTQLRAVLRDRTSATESVAHRLRRLTDLLDAGLITRDEHDARRREILDEV
jgi:hypothetical protein